ncbi:hypothetical protein [Acidithrix ferrooxidans]|uniref:Uncharacterized protein n=1 Tax=Acidithrix ferrooxidans TaxID=1280514 RepID=A0A0D8HL24_9ACTN|nr:hypothetical protein [Acidithrix ferrooxidans]KJF18417.1 hypothetical protein AXFE_08070 [Acidithrix ferrooxidans]
MPIGKRFLQISFSRQLNSLDGFGDVKINGDVAVVEFKSLLIGSANYFLDLNDHPSIASSLLCHSCTSARVVPAANFADEEIEL